MELIARTVGNAVGLWLATALLGGMHLAQATSIVQAVVAYLLVGLVLALVNSVVKPVAKVVAFPLYVLTFGLFALVVNGAMLMLTSALSNALGNGVVVDSFGAAVVGSVIVSVISAVVVGVIGPRKEG